jgi:hypothetical protein
MNLIKFCHYSERFMDMRALSSVFHGAPYIIYNTPKTIDLVGKKKKVITNAKMQK